MSLLIEPGAYTSNWGPVEVLENTGEWLAGMQRVALNGIISEAEEREYEGGETHAWACHNPNFIDVDLVDSGEALDEALIQAYEDPSCSEELYLER